MGCCKSKNKQDKKMSENPVLPKEIICEFIFPYLPPEESIKFSRCCKELYQLFSIYSNYKKLSERNKLVRMYLRYLPEIKRFDFNPTKFLNEMPRKYIERKVGFLKNVINNPYLTQDDFNSIYYPCVSQWIYNKNQGYYITIDSSKVFNVLTKNNCFINNEVVLKTMKMDKSEEFQKEVAELLKFPNVTETIVKHIDNKYIPYLFENPNISEKFITKYLFQKQFDKKRLTVNVFKYNKRVSEEFLRSIYDSCDVKWACFCYAYKNINFAYEKLLSEMLDEHGKDLDKNLQYEPPKHFSNEFKIKYKKYYSVVNEDEKYEFVMNALKIGGYGLIETLPTNEYILAYFEELIRRHNFIQELTKTQLVIKNSYEYMVIKEHDEIFEKIKNEFQSDTNHYEIFLSLDLYTGSRYSIGPIYSILKSAINTDTRIKIITRLLEMNMDKEKIFRAIFTYE